MANACVVGGCGAPILPRDDGAADGGAVTAEQRALFRCRTLAIRFAVIVPIVSQKRNLAPKLGSMVITIPGQSYAKQRYEITALENAR